MVVMGEESAGDGEGDKQQLLAEMTLLAKIKFYTSLFLGNYPAFQWRMEMLHV